MIAPKSVSKKYDSVQPSPVRVFIWSNALVWGFWIPVGDSNLGLNVFATLLCALVLPPPRADYAPYWLLTSLVLPPFSAFLFFIGPCESGGSRVLTTGLLMTASIWAIRRLSYAASTQGSILRENELIGLLATALLFAGIHLLFRLYWGVEMYGWRVGGLFREPSHLALSMAPISYFLIRYSARKMAICAGVVTVVLLVVAGSGTYLGIMVILFSFDLTLSLNRRHTRLVALKLLLLSLVAFAAVLSTDLGKPVLDRIGDVVTFNLSHTSNLSSLVYLNGWLTLVRSVEWSRGLGIGFNALGCPGSPITSIDETLQTIGLFGISRLDGSFLFAKVISELGFVGLLIWVTLIVLTIKIGLLTRNANQSFVGVRLLWSWTMVVIAGGFVRSGGYFTGPVFLAIFSLINLTSTQRLAIEIRSNIQGLQNRDDPELRN